jgi:hypothetical protein
MCAWHVRQFFASLDSPYTYHELVCQMTFWLNCRKNITHPDLHPMTFASLPIKYAHY